MRTRTLSFLSEAESDLDRAAAFYDRQAEGLGAEFVKSLNASIERLRETAGIHPVEHGFHRALSDRFPFMIYYEVAPTTVTIVAILDCHQSPPKRLTELWQRKPIA